MKQERFCENNGFAEGRDPRRSGKSPKAGRKPSKTPTIDQSLEMESIQSEISPDRRPSWRGSAIGKLGSQFV
jgi:hypothetical protein